MNHLSYNMFFHVFMVPFFFVHNGVAQSGWKIQNSQTTANLYTIQFLDAMQGYAAGDKGTVLKTIDGGARWQAASISTLNPVRAISFVTAAKGWVVTGDVNNSDVSGEIWKTTDGASTWVKQTYNSTRARLGVSFISENVGWACGARNGPLDVEATTDGGATFKTQSDAAVFGWTYGIEAVSSTTVWSTGGAFFPSVSGFVLYSTNGGTKWNQKNIGTVPFLYGIDFSDSMHGFVVGDVGAVYATTDGGNTWALQSTAVSSILRSISFSSPSRGWTCGDAGTLLGTTDGGKVWTKYSLSSSTNLNGIFTLDSDHAWTIGDNGSIWSYSTMTGVQSTKPNAPIHVQVYPVPAISQITFQIGNVEPDNDNLSLYIYNALGKEVYRLSDIRSTSLVLNGRALGNGIYFYEINGDNLLRARGKIIFSGI